MKILKILSASILALALLGTSACSKVPVGHVGIKAYLLGGSKGVDSEELKPGRYWIGVNEELFLFPTFTQTYVWTKATIDGDSTDESITFQSIEGMNVNADVGITYSVDATKVTTLFEKYRKGIDEITDTQLRNLVRDAFVAEAGKLKIEDVYTSKEKLLQDVQTRVSTTVHPLGINVEKLYWAGGFRLPKQVTDAINNTIQAAQDADKEEQKVRLATARANQAIEDARGQAESTLLVAQAEADSIKMKGKALQEFPDNNRLAIQRWNGELPVTQAGGAVPFIQVPSGR